MKNESRVKTQWAHPLRVRWIYPFMVGKEKL